MTYREEMLARNEKMLRLASLLEQEELEREIRGLAGAAVGSPEAHARRVLLEVFEMRAGAIATDRLMDEVGM